MEFRVQGLGVTCCLGRIQIGISIASIPQRTPKPYFLHVYMLIGVQVLKIMFPWVRSRAKRGLGFRV